MSRAWRLCLPGIVLSAPLTIIAFVYLLARGARSWRWEDGYVSCLSAKLLGSPGGQCWSPLVAFSREENRARADLRVHELCHVAQVYACTMAGALVASGLVLVGLAPWWVVAFAWLVFPVLYGGDFLIQWIRRGFGPWQAAYFAIGFERFAYARQAQFKRGVRPGAWGST